MKKKVQSTYTPVLTTTQVIDWFRDQKRSFLNLDTCCVIVTAIKSGESIAYLDTSGVLITLFADDFYGVFSRVN